MYTTQESICAPVYVYAYFHAQFLIFALLFSEMSCDVISATFSENVLKQQPLSI